jgi:hypothetical protein
MVRFHRIEAGAAPAGSAITAGSFSGRTALFEGVYERFDSFTRFQIPGIAKR